MALHCLGLFRPIQLVKVAQQLVRVGGYLKKPLGEILPHHLGAAAFAMPVYHLLVCEHGIAGSAPVHGRFLAVGKPRLVELKEYPLRPFIVVGHARFHLVIPIEHAAHGLQLVLHCGDVFKGGILRMNARFYRVIFRRQTERVKAHRLENFITLHTLKAGKAVRRAEVIPMPHVQFCAGGVGEHLQGVILFVAPCGVEGVNLIFLPLFLPLFFNLDKVHFSLRKVDI